MSNICSGCQSFLFPFPKFAQSQPKGTAAVRQSREPSLTTLPKTAQISSIPAGALGTATERLFVRRKGPSWARGGFGGQRIGAGEGLQVVVAEGENCRQKDPSKHRGHFSALKSQPTQAADNQSQRWVTE